MHQTNFVIKSFAGRDVVISGYASVYNIADQHNDIIIKGAFAGAEVQRIKFLWQHDSQKPIGIINSLKEDDYGLLVEATINGHSELGREVIALVTQGAVDGLSVGFTIRSADYNNSFQRLITEAELMEVSIVTFPANRHAGIQHIATCEDDISNLGRIVRNLSSIVNNL